MTICIYLLIIDYNMTNKDSHNSCSIYQEYWAPPKCKIQLNFNGEKVVSHGQNCKIGFDSVLNQKVFKTTFPTPRKVL